MAKRLRLHMLLSNNKAILLLLVIITSYLFLQVAHADNLHVDSTINKQTHVDSIINKQTRQIKNLSSRVETLENALFDLRNELSELKGIQQTTNESSNQSPNIEANLSSQISATNDFMSKKEIIVPKDKLDYDIALSLLKEGKFSNSEKKFAEFISNHPKSKLQSNAHFWYAESFYRQGAYTKSNEMYNKAAIHYLRGYKQYPQGAKAADSLLKLSYTLNILGKNAEACSMLDKLEKEFPNRAIDSIKRSKEAKSKFHCK